jgi:hypothetical protein
MEYFSIFFQKMLLFFGGTGVQTQDLQLASQMFCHLSHAPRLAVGMF